MTVSKLTFEVINKVDANDIINLLVNAFDSGVMNYWASSAEVNLPDDFDINKVKWLKDPGEWEKVRKVYIAPLIKGGSVEIFDEYEKRYCTLNIQGIERGIQVMASNYPRHWNDFRTNNDDADTGDVFVQCCVFGEIIYS